MPARYLTETSGQRVRNRHRASQATPLVGAELVVTIVSPSSFDISVAWMGVGKTVMISA